MDTAIQALTPVFVYSATPVLEPEWTRRGLLALAGPDLMAAGGDEGPAAIFVDRSAGRALPDVLQMQRGKGATLVVDSALADALPAQAADAEIVDTLGDSVLAAATVAAILRRIVRAVPPPANEACVLSPSVSFDISSRCIRRGSGVQPLSPTEFRLLLALCQAKGRPCSHDELVARVWGADRGSGHHYLRLYVRYLRHKIEEDPQHPCLLQNVWGVGYRLSCQPLTEIASETGIGSEPWTVQSSSARRRL